jgi:hypothetical protein
MLLSARPVMHGQSVPGNAPPPRAEDEQLVVLSPFVVNASEDLGYQATSTLAGTRIRTDLREVGSAISVVTPKFLSDIGARSNESLLKYTVSTEVGGVGGNFTGTGNGREIYENGLLLRPNGNTRVRGLSQADNTRDFFLTDIPWDGYNVGRIDIQRGPNAILFGMGSPAGIINSSTNPASFKNSNEIAVRYDNEGSYRGSIDLNRVLLKNELAFRLAAVDDLTYYRQKPAYNRDVRVYGAVNYVPAFLKKNGMETSLRMNFEHGDINANRARSLTPVDEITPWFTVMNKKTFDPRVAWRYDANNPDSLATGYQRPDKSLNPAYANVGAYGNIFGNPVAIFSPGSTHNDSFRTLESNGYWGIGPDNAVSAGNLDKANANNYYGIGSPGAWRGGIGGIPFAREIGVNSYANYMNSIVTGAKNADGSFVVGSPYTSLDAYKDRTLSDSGVYDFYNHLLDGPNKKEWRGFEAENIALAQTFLENRLGLEAVYDKQLYHDGQKGSVRQVLAVDINTTYIDGEANPNLGKAFVQSDDSGSEYNTRAESMRLTGFGEFRTEDFMARSLLTKILGRHVFTGMYAEEKKDTRSLNFTSNGMDAKYAYDVAGNEVGSGRIDSGTLSALNVSYLSGNLSGFTSASQSHINPITVVQTPDTQNGKIYRFDSHWNKPVNPADPGYVNPAALWTPPTTSDGTTQSDNPANYKGWGFYDVGSILKYDDGQVRYNNGQKTYRKVKSQAFVWQGFLLDSTLVPSIGWRRDVFKGGYLDTYRDQNNQVMLNDSRWTINPDNLPMNAGESLSYSVVGHLPKFLKEKLPFGADFSVFYNRSENFQPRPGQVDMFGVTLANPAGKTKDYGFLVSVLDERLSLKVNWYQTNVSNDRLQNFAFWKINQFAQTMLASAYRVNHKDAANTWKWDYGTQWGGLTLPGMAAEQAKADAGAAYVISAYDSNPIYRKFVDGWGLKPYFTNEYASNNMPAGLSATTDTISKGMEFELNAKPTPNWDVAFNAAKTSATQNNIGGALKEWVEAMTPLANGPAGDLRQWWAGDGNNFRAIWARDILAQFNLLKLQEGSNVPELRPWRFNLISNYAFTENFLKGSNVGVAYRWEDSVVTGYGIKSAINSTTGLTDYSYDIQHPFKGPSEKHLDFWLGYGHKVTSKIGWRIQLNVRDILARKKLIPISVNPDGTPAAYRIPDLTSWSLTNTFNF